MSGHTKLCIATLMITAFIIGTDFTGALLLVSAIESEFSANITTTQWVLNIYAMTFAMFMVSGGRLGDMHGRKRLMLAGLVIFVAAAAACQFAPTIGWLIGARAVQGVGAAIIWPCLLAFGSSIVKEDERGFVMGLILAGVTCGNVAGPLLGGLVVYIGDWRHFFLVNVVVATLSFVLVWRILPREAPTGKDQRIDYAGMFVLSAAILVLLYSLDVGADWGWASPPLLGLLGLCVLLLIAFPLVELRVSDPLVPLPLMRNRQFLLTLSTNALIVPTFFIAFLYFPQFMNKTMGWSVLQASFGMLQLMVPLTVGSIISGNYYQTFGPKRLLLAGYLLNGLAALWCVFLVPSWGYFAILPAMVLIGLGAPLAVGPSGTAVVSAVAPERAGLAGGLSFMMHLSYGAIGIAGATAIMYSTSVTSLKSGLEKLGISMSAADQATINTGAANSEAARSILARFGNEDAEKIRTLLVDAFADGMSSAYWIALISVAIGLLVIWAIDESKLHDADT